MELTAYEGDGVVDLVVAGEEEKSRAVDGAEGGALVNRQEEK